MKIERVIYIVKRKEKKGLDKFFRELYILKRHLKEYAKRIKKD